MPFLRFAGYEVLVDYLVFKAGRHTTGEMDRHQDRADRQLLLLSQDYLKSAYCRHEMERALPLLPEKRVIPLLLEEMEPPATIPDYLWVSLWHGKEREGWDLLCRSLGFDPGVPAGAWVEALCKARRLLERNQSVNLVAEDGQGQAWRGLVDQLISERELKLGCVDFESGIAAWRPSLLQEILETGGLGSGSIPDPPADLAVFTREMRTLSGKRLRQTWSHFSHIIERAQRNQSGESNGFNRDFFSAVRHLVMEKKCLVLLIHSKRPMAEWIEQTHELSKIDFRQVSF